MDQTKIGSFIRELRKEKGLTQEQFAQKFNVTQKSVSRWEPGRNMPDLSILQDIAEELDVSVIELLNGEKCAAENEKETKKVILQLIDFSSDNIKNRIVNLEEIDFITWALWILCIILLLIGVFIQHETISLMIIIIMVLSVFLRLCFGRCPACGKLIPLFAKKREKCPYCGVDLFSLRRRE